MPPVRPNPEMYRAIREELERLEQEAGIEVLFAVEYGSHAWGLQAPGSDHDIRFIYKTPPTEAFSLFEEKDIMKREVTLPRTAPEAPVDLIGWSLQKALRLSVVSNPQLGEFRASPILYRRQDVFGADLDTLVEAASPRVMGHYYRGTATKNLLSRIERAESVGVKEHIQTVRALMNVVWLLQNRGTAQFPPIDFVDLLEATDISARGATQAAVSEIAELVDLKRAGIKRVNGSFDAVRKWALREIECLRQDVMVLPDPHVEQELAERAFRNQYPRAFNLDDAPVEITP